MIQIDKIEIETKPHSARLYDELFLAGLVRAPYEICGITREDYYKWLSKLVGEKIQPKDLSQHKTLPRRKIVVKKISKPVVPVETKITVSIVKPVEKKAPIVLIKKKNKPKPKKAPKPTKKWANSKTNSSENKNPELVLQIQAYSQKGFTQQQISDVLSISRQTLNQIIKRTGIKLSKKRPGPKKKS